MGSCCSSEKSRVPTTDIFVDKIIKYIAVPIVGILALICLIFLYLVDKVSCYVVGTSTWTINVNEFCWNNFTALTSTTSRQTLPHKLFPIIALCEAMSLILPLIIWYWCFGNDMKNQITAVIDSANTLTNYYRMYDKGMRKTVSESTLHRELDNFLELLLNLLMIKMPKIYVLYTLKWIVVIIMCFAWILGHMLLLFSDFTTLTVFQDSFLCVGQGGSAQCSIPTSTFLRAVWYINIAFLVFIAICTFIFLIIIGRELNFTSTFFYHSVPGLMDSRLSDCIQETFNSRYYSLISRFCEDNIHLCSDPGLSRSLSRKYGVPDGSTPGRETIMDKHFPVLQPEQLKKFRVSCEMFRTNKHKHDKHKNRSKVRFAQGKDDTDSKSIISVTDSYISRISTRSTLRRNKVENFDCDYYLTPRLMARKMGKDLKSIKNSSRLSSLNNSQRTPRSISSVDIGQFTPRSSTPTPRSTEVSNRRQNITYTNVHPQTTGHYPVFASRNRELNPYAYRLHLLIKQANAKHSSAWKP